MYRDHPRTGAALVAHVAYLFGMSVAVGSGIWFLVVLVTALVGEEAFGSEYAPFDTIVRHGIGFISLALIAGLGIGAVAIAARRVATARQLDRSAREHPELVATWADRRDIEVESAFGQTYVFVWVFSSSLVLAAVLVGVALGETFRYNPESAWEGVTVLVAMLVLAVVTGAFGLLVRLVLRPRYDVAAAWVRAEWDERTRAAATKDERQRRTGAEHVEFGATHRIIRRIERFTIRASAVVAPTGFVIFMAGVYLRQPCRRCDQRYWGEPIESVIDVLVTIGGPLLVLSLLLVFVAALAALSTRILERGMLRQLAKSGARRPRPAVLVEHLTEDGPGKWVGATLIAAVVPAAVVAAVAGLPVVVLGLAAVAVVGVVVMAASVGADGRFRNLLRAAWSPGDPVPPKPDARKRTARARDAGDADDSGVE